MLTKIHQVWHPVPRGWWLICGVYLVLALGYNVVFPPFEPTDEFHHFRYVRHLIEQRAFPVMTVDDPSEFHQPPGYYLLAAGLSAFFPADNFFAEYTQRVNPYWGFRQWEAGVDNKNLYTHGPWDLWPFTGISLSLHSARLASLLLGGVTLWFTFQLARSWLDESTALAITGVTAFQPMFLAVSASLQTDAASAALGAVIAWLALRFYQLGFTPRRLLILGLVVGLGGLFKLTIVFLIGPCGLLWVWWAWRAKRPWPHWLGGLALIALGTVLTGGWWYLRNQLVYGEASGLGVDLAAYGSQPVALGIALWPQSVPYAWTSFWGRFARGEVPFPSWIYWVFTLLSICAMLGLAWRLWRKDLAEATPALFKILLSLTTIAALMTVLTLTSSGYFGRYLFPALAAIMTLFVFGLHAFVPKQWLGAFNVGLPLGMFTLSALTLPLYLSPVFNPPPILSQIPAHIAPLDVQLGDVAHLRGFQLSARSVRPGELYYLTLYWEPLRQTELPYSIYIHLFDSDQILVAQRDTYPGLGRNATTAWTPGALFADDYLIEIPDTAYPSLSTRFEIGLWQTQTHDRAFVLDAKGEPVAAGVTLPEGPSIIGAIAHELNTVAVNFSGEVQVTGYALSTRTLTPGQLFELSLDTQLNSTRALNYFVHVTSADGLLWANAAFPVQAGLQTLRLPLATDTPPGLYNVLLGVAYDSEAGPVRLQRLAAEGNEVGDMVRLTGARVNSQ